MIYSNSAFGPPYKNIARLSTQIEPNYFFGSRDYKTEPFMFTVTNVALTTNVATVTGTLVSGGGDSPNNVPLVGAKMGIRGSTNTSGLFNVDPATVTAVTWTPSTGVAVVSFALVHANVTSASDVGSMVVQSAEIPDLVSSGTASAPFALVFTPDESDNSRCLFAECTWTGTMPTSATVSLQVANVDDDARYQSLPTPIATVAGSAVTLSGGEYSFVAGKFLRVKVTAMAGGDGTTGLICTIFA
jgi:hypothetical protein